MEYIIDASALLALLKNEKGAEKVKKIFEDAKKRKLSVIMHAVNFIEVVYKFRKFVGQETCNKILATFTDPFFSVLPFFDTTIYSYSAELKSKYHLSLGDSIGLAFTAVFKGKFYTCDKALKEIAEKEGINIEIIR